MSNNQFKQLTDKEHVLLRPAMYIGAVDLTKTTDYILQNNKIQQMEISYVPGLIKIINEIIDNCVDVAIKTNFKSANQIEVKINHNSIEVKDNGTGIPVQKSESGEYIPLLCFSAAKSGSNFNDDENRTQIGMNGVGSFSTNCFSKKFTAVTDDGKKNYKVEFKNNIESYTEEVKKSTGVTGTVVKFFPDLERFGLTEIDEIHKNVIHQRLINLSMSFPKISFKFNSRKINVSSFKKYVEMFNPVSEIYETQDYKFAILPNPEDDFRQFSYVNGLKIPDGGTHIDIITDKVVAGLREKLQRKYKAIKPADIRNKLMVIAFLKNVKNTKFNSQSKEKITNSISEINAYYGSIDFDKLIDKIYKNKDIIDPITEIYRIKEEFKKRQELKNLSKPTKRITSDKYFPSIDKKKYLVLIEGLSAFGGISPVLGRKECGYFVLRGKPLNAYSSTQARFTQNEELSLLFQVIQNEDYEYIIFGTDQDLDGFHIRGLLLGFILRYLPEYTDKIGILQTPVLTVTKNKKLLNWYYSLSESPKTKSGEQVNYKKGLGSWKESELKEIVSKDGLEKMIDLLEFDSSEIIEDWLGNDSEPRKAYILDNKFSIAKL